MTTHSNSDSNQHAVPHSSTQPQPQPPLTEASFFGLGIAPQLLDAISKLGFTHPTPIQQKAIPLGIEGKDVLGIAQTGTGKTLAFGIPMLQQLAQRPGKGLVLVPTRELAAQVQESLRKVAPKTKMAVLIGGASMHNQIQEVRRHPQIIVATPGRLLDHMEQRTLTLNDVAVLVLDEADRMLDMGFAPQIQKVLRSVPKDRQTMLFSATMPQAILSMVTHYMKLPVQVEIAKAGTAADRVTQEIFILHQESKRKLLGKLLVQYHGPTLLFCRTKASAYKISRFIREMGHSAAEMHSDRSLAQRREALEGFRRGKYRVLVATDIASRGIDVSGIELVINYDIPEDPDNYIHRIGRTGRAGEAGHAISFATPDQEKDVRAIERVMNASIPVGEHPEVPTMKFPERAPQSPVRGIRRGPRFGRRSFGPRR